jgi:uncharacterized protein
MFDKIEIVRVFMSEDDRYQGEHMYETILNLAHDMRLAGATVIRGVEGFGASGRIHSARVVRCSEDLPIIVEIADKAERVEPFLAQAAELLDAAGDGGIVTVEEARLFSARRRAAGSAGASIP